MQFQYVAYTIKAGIVKGRLEARDEEDARTELIEQGYRPLTIKQPSQLSFDRILSSMDVVKPAELLSFARHTSTMLASGAHLLHALEMLQAEGSSRPMRKVLARLHERVTDGDSFTKALREHPKVFDDVFVSLVEVGEYTGRLGHALLELADIMEQAQEAKKRLVKAMMMPMFLIGSSILMLGFMAFVALPPLLDTFESMDVEVPFITRLMVGAVNFVVESILQIFIVVVLIFGVYKLLQRFPTTKYIVHVGKIRTPLMGGLMLASELGRFSRVMSTLLNAGVDLPSALRLAMDSTKNEALKRAWTDAEASLISGHRIAEALLKHSVLPQMFVELFAIGEEGNTLGKTLGELATAYEKQFEDRITAALGVAEPVSTFAAGGVVLAMAMSVMKPILSAASAVQ